MSAEATQTRVSRHSVLTVAEAGWAGVQNGELLRRAEDQFDAFITLDSSLPFPQNLSSSRLRIVLITARSNDINDLRPLIPDVLRVLSTLQPGSVATVGL